MFEADIPHGQIFNIHYVKSENTIVYEHFQPHIDQLAVGLPTNNTAPWWDSW